MTNDAGYHRRVYLRPAKLEPASARPGLNDATLVFAIEGPAGVASLDVLTGWFHPIADEATSEPAVYDLGDYPDGIVGFHSRTPLPESDSVYHGIQKTEACEALSGAPCWGTGSSVAGQPFVRRLMTEGDGAIWLGLEELYRHAFLDGDGVEYLEDLKARGRRMQEEYPLRHRADKTD